jgi:hypothetical protein
VANSVKKRKKEPEKKGDEDSELTYVKSQYEDAEQSSQEYRAEAEVYRRYYDGHQWTEAEKKALEARGQPVITDNKIKDKIETYLGIERKGRADPKAYPRNSPSDEEAADAATDALRFVADENLMQYAVSDAAENLFVEGLCGIDVCVDKKLGKKSRRPKIKTPHIRWDRLYADPHSFKCDYSDATFKGVITWMDIEAANDKWPDKKAVIEASFLAAPTTTETHDDKPRYVINSSGRKRIQVLEHHYLRKGQWHRCVFVGAGFLEEPAVSAYVDEEGEPVSSLELQAMYRDGEDGTPYGAIRRYKDLQDDWNKRRSKSLHLLNTNQVVAEEGMLDEEQKAEIRKEAARPDGVISSPTGAKLTINKNLDLAQGHVNLMLLTGQALDATGPNAALAGQTGDISGRAKQVDQQGGLLAIDKPFDGIKHLKLRVYRQIWYRVVQFWTMETWIRVRDEEHLKFVALNRQTTKGELAAKALKGRKDLDQEQVAAIITQLAQDPESQKPAKENDVAEIDVDIILDETQDVVTLQQEQFSIIAELAKGRPELFKQVVELSSLTAANKRKVLDQDAEPDPMQQQMAAMQMKMAELELQGTELANLLAEAKVQREVAATAKDEAAAKETAIDSIVKTATYISGPDAEAPAEKRVNVN